MPVPTLVTDLSTTLASNSPAGSDNVFPDLDNYLRALSGFVASIRDNSGNGWVSPYLPLTYSAGTANGVVYLNGSKVVTTGSGLVFDGTNFSTTGTATATKLIPTGGSATGNGMYLPAANTLAWSNNGAETMRLDASGNLGIGISSPQAVLHVNKATSSTFRLSANNVGVDIQSLDGAGYGLVSTYTAHPLVFATAATERARIDSSGNFGIGTTSPSEKLHVNGATSTYIRVSSTNASTGSGLLTSNATNSYLIGAGAVSGLSGLEFRDVTNSATRMVLTSGGNLGIGTTSVSARLHVSGNDVYTIPVSFAGAAGNASWTTGFGSQAVNASILATDSVIGANIYSVSDERLKSNITPLPGNAGLDFVKAVDPVSFDWKSDNSHDTGFIAQSLMSKGYGHLVSAIPDGAMEEVTHEDGNVSPAGARFVVRYDSIVPILHAAIRDQQALIEALMARVAALEAA